MRRYLLAVIAVLACLFDAAPVAAQVENLPPYLQATLAQFGHNHMSKVLAFNTLDEYLGHEILDFMARGR
jgi:hypothetical protein